MDEEVETAELVCDRRHHVGNLAIAGNVAGQHERVGQLGRELTHVFLEPLTLIGDGEPRPRGSGRARDRPCNRALVRNPDDEAVLPRQFAHGAPPDPRFFPTRGERAA
jgi:hypothetical protein